MEFFSTIYFQGHQFWFGGMGKELWAVRPNRNSSTTQLAQTATATTGMSILRDGIPSVVDYDSTLIGVVVVFVVVALFAR